MPNLYYFVPKAQTMAQATAALDKAGLEYVPKVTPTFAQAGAGEHGPGMIVGVPDARGEVDLHRLRYVEAGQSWLHVPGSKVMVGCYEDAPPTPEDLARERQVEGHGVTLGDKQRWRVPAARRWTVEDGEPRCLVALPTKRTLSPEGKWTASKIADRFASLWDRLERLAQARAEFVGGDKSALDWCDVSVECELVVDALSVNYRVGPAEVALLGLIESGTFLTVLDALEDGPTYKDLVGKEQAPGEDSTSPGAEG